MINNLKAKLSKYVISVISKEITLLKDNEIKDLNEKIDLLERKQKKTANKLISKERSIVLSEMTRNNIWFFSLKKSGTTYTINFLTNYINILYNKSNSPILPGELLMFHSTHNKVKNIEPFQIIAKQQKILLNTQYSNFVHTHDKIKSFALKNICIDRNPLDFIVSMYFFTFKDRGIEVSINDKWKDIADQYIKVKAEQIKISKLESVLHLKYEDIVSDRNEFRRIIDFLNFEYDQESYDKALEYSSKESFKKTEQKRGSPLIVPKGTLNRKSFIRSGEVDDWKNHLNPELASEIMDYIEMKLSCNYDG